MRWRSLGLGPQAGRRSRQKQPVSRRADRRSAL